MNEFSNFSLDIPAWSLSIIINPMSLKRFFAPWCCCLLVSRLFAQSDPAADGMAAWHELKRQPITENSFHAVCDLMQQIGKTDLTTSFRIMQEYTPMVKATQKREWVHILLMGWAKAKESLGFFPEADSLYREARLNAAGTGRMEREALANTVLMYGEWDKKDSLQKYITIGERECLADDDKENLSFIYTFKALSDLGDTAAMGRYLQKAIALANDLPDKNALFTARYNYANIVLQYSPPRQAAEFESLLELAKDPSLNHYPRKLYERTAFTFRNAGPSIIYQLMQINLVLTDYENAWKFAELFYNATIKPNPDGVQAPYFNAEMAVVKFYQGDYAAAENYLSESKKRFRMPEENIPYATYFVAKGLLAEHKGDYVLAAAQFGKVSTEHYSIGTHLLPPELHYAHVLVLTKKWKEAGKIFDQFRPSIEARKYTATGLYYHRYYAAFLQAKGDYPAYARSLNTYYTIRDSLASLNQYRAVQVIMANVRMKEKDQRILLLNEENENRRKQIRQERIFYILLVSLAGLIILLLVLYLRYRQIRSRQREALQQSKLEQLEKQKHIELMQSVIEAEENERRKIADQLHDEVNAMLALATLNISSALEKGTAGAEADAQLQKAQEVLSSVSTTIRELSHRLTPLLIEKYGFRKAIEDLAQTINISGKLKLETVITGFEDTRKYPAGFLNDLYRISQELLHNVLKHAHATHALLELVEHEKQVSLMVEDNGIGIAEDQAEKGKGLNNIKSRVAYVNGRIEISHKKDNGTLIVIEIPV